MAKKVSQDYFDAIVNENVSEFGMSEEEAIADAVNQIKSQGADLSLVCKFSMSERAQLTDSLQALHNLLPALTVVKAEQARLGAQETRKAIELLELIRHKFNQDISYRCFATALAQPQPNTYNIFTSYLGYLAHEYAATNAYNFELIEAFLTTFQAYLTQQSDVLDEKGKLLLIKLTKDDGADTFNSNSSSLSALLRCINASCQLNEPNRQFYVENGLCENLMLFFGKHRGSDLVISDACVLIRSLLLDDDVRSEFGKSHEHAKYIASELNGLDVLLQIGLVDSGISSFTVRFDLRNKVKINCIVTETAGQVAATMLFKAHRVNGTIGGWTKNAQLIDYFLSVVQRIDIESPAVFCEIQF